MTKETPENSQPLSQKDLAWEKVINFALEERVWTMEEAGFRQVDGRWQRHQFTRDDFMQLALRWEVTSLHSSRPRVMISEELARTLPRLSTPDQIAYATQVGCRRLEIELDNIFSRPTQRRNDLELKGERVGFITSMFQDEYLYILILTHFAKDVKRLANEEHMDPIEWLRKFQKELGEKADQRFPGLWDR